MKIIISSTGKKWSDSIDPHFEHAKGFVRIRSINQGNFIDFVNNLLTERLNKDIDLVSIL